MMDATLLVKTLVNSEEYKQFIQTLLKETIKDELKYLHKEVDNLKQKVTNMEEEIERLKGENHDLKIDYDKVKEESLQNQQTLTSMQNHLKRREQIVEDLQQYTRRNCVIVTGVPEAGKNEDTDSKIKELAKDKMDLNIEDIDLDRTHRIGKPQDGKPRPIVVKFTRYNTRHEFMKNRKKLKGTKVGVNDLLTLEARNLLKRAQDLVQQYNAVLGAWTWDGKVMVQVNFDDGKKRKYQVRSMDDIHDIRDHGYPGPKIGKKK